MTQTMIDERRPVEGFPHYLITRHGAIYSTEGRELFPGTDDVDSTRVELRLPGDEIGKLYDLAKLIKRAFSG